MKKVPLVVQRTTDRKQMALARTSLLQVEPSFLGVYVAVCVHLQLHYKPAVTTLRITGSSQEVVLQLSVQDKRNTAAEKQQFALIPTRLTTVVQRRL